MEDQNFIDAVGDIIKIIWIILLSVFAPIAVSIYILSLFFLVNIFVGYHSDRIVNQRNFSLEKIRKGVSLLILYFILLFIINISLSLYGEIELSETIPKFFTWIASYFYLINIVRNAKQIFPKNIGLNFFYEILTIQVFDMILGKFGIKMKKPNFEDDEEKDKR